VALDRLFLRRVMGGMGHEYKDLNAALSTFWRALILSMDGVQAARVKLIYGYAGCLDSIYYWFIIFEFSGTY
jgi:hypothetical protein